MIRKNPEALIWIFWFFIYVALNFVSWPSPSVYMECIDLAAFLQEQELLNLYEFVHISMF